VGWQGVSIPLGAVVWACMLLRVTAMDGAKVGTGQAWSRGLRYAGGCRVVRTQGWLVHSPAGILLWCVHKVGSCTALPASCCGLWHDV
jgi:hypothetical protein